MEKRMIQGGFHDILAPSALEFQTQQFIFGDQVGKVTVIVDYPPDVGAAWISRIAQLPGVICSIHITPTDPYALIQSINIAIGELVSRVENGGNALTVQRAEEQLEHAKTLLKKIDQEQQQVFYYTCVLMTLASDSDSLKRRVKRVEATLAGAGMRGRSLLFRQEEGLNAAGPWAALPDEVSMMGNRNMPSETIAASFPFTSSGINDGEGIVLGRDKDGGVMLVDLWRRGGDRTNSNFFVVGKPGVGKSTVVKKILANAYGQGCRVLVLDPEREYKDLCANLNGKWIDCGGGKEGRINPLQVKQSPKDEETEEDKERLYQKEVQRKGALAMHFQNLRTFFTMYLKDVDAVEMSMLEVALEELYQSFSIGWDIDPVAVPNDKWPTMADLYSLLKSKIEGDNIQVQRWEKLVLLIRKAAIGADSFLWNGHTTLSADADFVVLDIYNLLDGDESIKRAQYYNILSWAWNEVARDRKEKILLAVDEAYLLADPEAPQALAFLRNTNKRIRKYEGGLLTITQNVVDFTDPSVKRYGQALVDNPCYKLLMGMGENDLASLTELMFLSEAEQELLGQGTRGEALLVAGSKRVRAKIELAGHEIELFGEGGGR
ncbi:MAG: DUF87 domain-containing protein [Firmicutes bacterium]|nr:DUF87 domain-containing protein [Bacillota bacterium]